MREIRYLGLSAVDVSFVFIPCFAFVGLMRCACAAAAYLCVSAVLSRVAIFVVSEALSDVAVSGKDFNVVHLIIQNQALVDYSIRLRRFGDAYKKWSCCFL